MHIRKIIGFVLVLGALSSAGAAAQGADTAWAQQGVIGYSPPRLSLITGEVSFWRPGAQDWSEARVNTPLTPGDLLYTGHQANFELQIGARAFVRGGPNTQLGLENHEPDFLQFKVTTGNASFDLTTVESGRTVEVDTPHAAFTIEREGYFRVTVNGERTSFITRRGGQAMMTYPGGSPVAVGPSEEVIIEGIKSPQVASYAAPPLDEWDKWNYARTDHLLDAVSARYVSPGVYGLDDLDRYGTWRIVPTYGAVWVPRGVAYGWAPYSTGAWVLDPYYGWTWVDTAPWGWAPYHYGRWVFVSGFWAWAPGPIVVRPAYAPALVVFFGGPGAGVSISVGYGPLIGWIALGWGEPCLPWWGTSTFRHRPWWGGWGGPRIVNNVIINERTVVNVNEIHTYRNVTAKNALVVVKDNHFGRGPVMSGRVTQVDTKNFKPSHTAPSVTATPASFVPGERRGITPPKEILNRPIVATRPQQSREGSEHIKGRDATPAIVPIPAPRIVSAPRQREGDPLPKRPPYGQSKVERPTTDRAHPPEPPKAESPQVLGRVPESAPRVTPRAPQQQQKPQAARPSPTQPQSSGRQTEAQAPQTRILPGEPANRLSPNWNLPSSQQRKEQPQNSVRVPSQSRPKNVPRSR